MTSKIVRGIGDRERSFFSPIVPSNDTPCTGPMVVELWNTATNVFMWTLTVLLAEYARVDIESFKIGASTTFKNKLAATMTIVNKGEGYAPEFLTSMWRTKMNEQIYQQYLAHWERHRVDQLQRYARELLEEIDSKERLTEAFLFRQLKSLPDYFFDTPEAKDYINREQYELRTEQTD